MVDHHLQERKLDLEAVLVRVGLVIDAHAQLGERELTCRRIDRNEPERRSESIRTGDGHPGGGNVVAGAEEHNPLHAVACRGEAQVCGCSDGGGVDVAGVRHDERLRGGRLAVRPDGGVEGRAQGTAQLLRCRRIERAGHGRRADSQRAGVFHRASSRATRPMVTGRRLAPHPPGEPSNTPGSWVPHT